MNNSEYFSQRKKKHIRSAMLQTELVKRKRKRKIYENTQLIILNSKVKEEALCVGEE